MKKFEYKTIQVHDKGFWETKIDYTGLTEHLNKLGAEGWELVTSLDINWNQGGTKEVVLLLKRERAN